MKKPKEDKPDTLGKKDDFEKLEPLEPLEKVA